MFAEWDGFVGPNGLRVGSRAHIFDEDFNEIIEIARRDIPREFGEQMEPEDMESLEDYLTLALHRMRAGFRKAERRFGDGWGGAEQYRAIKEAVRDCRPAFEGQEFVLSYGNGEATCREALPSDWQ